MMEIHVILKHTQHDIEWTETEVVGAQPTHDEAERFVQKLKDEFHQTHPSQEMITKYHQTVGEEYASMEMPKGLFAEKPKLENYTNTNRYKAALEMWENAHRDHIMKSEEIHNKRNKIREDVARRLSEGKFGPKDFHDGPDIYYEIVPTTLEVKQ